MGENVLDTSPTISRIMLRGLRNEGEKGPTTDEAATNPGYAKHKEGARGNDGQVRDGITDIMAFIQLAVYASLVEGTKLQKSSRLK